MMSENYALSLRCTPWPFLCSQGQGERALAMGTEAAYDTVAFDYKSLTYMADGRHQHLLWSCYDAGEGGQASHGYRKKHQLCLFIGHMEATWALNFYPWVSFS